MIWTADQEALHQSTRDVVARAFPMTEVRAGRSGESLAQEMGWTAIPFREAHGGLGLGLAEVCVVLEALGRALVPTPLVGSTVLAGHVLQALDHPDARRVASGELVAALAWEERQTRFDHRRIRATGEVDAGWRLRGEKEAVLDGGAAGLFLVVVRTRTGLGVFPVPRDTPGLEVEALGRVDGRDAARLRFDVVLPEHARLPFEPFPQALDRGAIALAAELLGIAQEALDRTVAWLRTRHQFGVPIGSFQALQHRAARMFIEVELARSAVLAAAEACDRAPPAEPGAPPSPTVPRLASLAKARANDAAHLVCNEAIQMFGGIGMTDEHDIGLFLKRARVAIQTLGDSPWHRGRWATLAGY